MTDEQLAELEDLAAAASGLPWVAGSEKDDDDRREFFLCFGDDRGVAGEMTQAWSESVTAGLIRWEDERYARTYANLQYAAAAANAVPELVAEIRRLRTLLGERPTP